MTVLLQGRSLGRGGRDMTLTCRDLSYQRFAPFLLQPPPWRSCNALLVSLRSPPPGASRHTRQMQRSIMSRESRLVESVRQPSTTSAPVLPRPVASQSPTQRHQLDCPEPLSYPSGLRKSSALRWQAVLPRVCGPLILPVRVRRMLRTSGQHPAGETPTPSSAGTFSLAPLSHTCA
jgi:hypothetical protein